METKFYNGCSKPETLELFNMFHGNPHCHTFGMKKCDDCEDESVYIGFTHYEEDFLVQFNSVTKVGEVLLNYKFEDEWESEYYGIITADKLLSLLKKLPHIADFLEDKSGQGEIIH